MAATVKRGRFKTLNEKDHPGRQPPHAGLTHLIDSMKKEIKARGSDGFLNLQRRFRIMDDDGSKSLSLLEFKKALQEFKLNLTEVDIRALFEYFDRDENGTIDFEEFVQGVRDPLSENRLKLVNLAFRVLDKDESGEVDFQEIASVYDASKHPEVISRVKTAQQVLVQFLNTFEVGGARDGVVTKQEFINYYANLSASIDNDDYFELMIRNAWHLSGGNGAAANSSNLRVLVTDSSGKDRTVVLQSDLGLDKSDVVAIYSRLVSQGETDVKAINGKKLQFTTENNRLVVAVAAPAPVVQTLEAPHFKLPHLDRLPRVKGGGESVGKPIKTASTPLQSFSPSKSPSEPMFKAPRETSPIKLQQEQMRTEHKNLSIISTLLDVLRVQLLSRGATGIIDLQRKFVEMDKDGSKSLDYGEFRQALLTSKLTFSEDQLQALFGYFDTDGSGGIDYEELLYGLRGQLPPGLLVLVHQVFDLLDRQGVDSIDPQTLIAHFDAGRHPEVLSAARSAQAVQKEFLDTFDVGGELPGRITRAEFVRYYTNIRASYNDDDYLEVVLRKVWHLGEEVSTASMAAYKSHLAGRDKEVSTLASKLRQAQTLDAAAASRRPSSAAAARRPSASPFSSSGPGAYGAFNQNFTAPMSGNTGSNNYSNNNSATFPAPPSSSFPTRPQSAGPLGRGRLNPAYNRSNAPVAVPSSSYEQVEVVDAAGNVDEDAVWKAAKKIQSEAVQCYNNQQFAAAEEKFRDVFEVMKMLFSPTHPEYIKAEKSCAMVQRKRTLSVEQGRPGSSRGYNF